MNCECGNALGPRNKSGSCRTCSARAVCARLNADPANKAKARATMRAWSPEQRAAKVAHLQNRTIPPEEMERRRARGAELMATVLSRPDVVAKREASRARAGQRRTATTLPWCPTELVPMYRAILAKHGMTAAQAREMVEDHIRKEARRTIAKVQLAAQLKHERELAQRY